MKARSLIARLARRARGRPPPPPRSTAMPAELFDTAGPPGPATLVGFGHSHLSCYLRAWQARRRRGRAGDARAHFVRLGHPDFQPNFEISDGARRISPALEKRIGRILARERPRAVLCALMGNEYNSLAMIPHPEPFDIDWPGERIADPAAQPIPPSLMRAEMAEIAARNALMLWRAIAAAAECPVYLVPPPPPIADGDHIRAHPGRFGEMVARHGLNPAPMRRRMWRIYRDVLSDGVAGSGTIFVDLPGKVMEDGYLARRFWRADPTHANAAYGEIMLTRILSRIAPPAGS